MRKLLSHLLLTHAQENAHNQYFSPLAQHPDQWLSIILKKKVLNRGAVQLNPEISSIKGKS